MTGILTFTAVALQLYACISVFADILFLWPSLTILILKSIPDFLILHNTTMRYGKNRLMRWFLPAQLIYPFYVMGVLLYKMVPLHGRFSLIPHFRKEFDPHQTDLLFFKIVSELFYGLFKLVRLSLFPEVGVNIMLTLLINY